MKTETVNSAEDTLVSLKKLLIDMGYTANDLFLLAVTFFKEKEGGKALEVPYKERIYMLALVKQAKFGKYVSNTSTDVGILNLAGNDMRRVWQTFKDMPKEEAMKQFLTKLINFSPLFDPYVRAHIELEKKRQKEDLDHVLESERSRAEQERTIRTELNRQTERQFREYAEFMYPRNREAQNRLIEGLQEQHFTQYMDQAYNFRLQAMAEINQSASLVISTPPQSDPYNPNTPLQQNSVVKEVRMPDIPRTKDSMPNKAQAEIYTGWEPTWVGHGDNKPKEFVREILPPDLPKPKSSKIVNGVSQKISNSNGNSESEKFKDGSSLIEKQNKLKAAEDSGRNIITDNKTQKDAKHDEQKKDNSSTANTTNVSENTDNLKIDDKENKKTKKKDTVVTSQQEVLSHVAESNNNNKEISNSSAKQNGTISVNLKLVEENMKSDQTSDVTEGEPKVKNNSSQEKKKNIINYDNSTIPEKVISKTSGSQQETKECSGDAKVEPGNIWMRKDRESFLRIAQSEPESRITVAAGESVTIRIPPNEGGKGLFCEFATDSYDIGFGLFYERLRSAASEEDQHEDNGKDLDGDLAAVSVARGKGWKARRIIDKIIPVERRNSNVDVICISHAYPPYEGTYHIKFDNTFSYWHRKTIYYRIYYTR